MGLPPSRLDHRFNAVVEACQFSQTQALYMLRQADSLTRHAYDFKRLADAGLDTSKWPEISTAVELQIHRQHERVFCEGLLLAGCDNAIIAQHMGCAPNDVQTFHDLFFDVRPYRMNPGWIVARVFSGSLYQSISPRDSIGKLHRLAWLGGEDVFLAFYNGSRDAIIGETLTNIINDVLKKQSLLTSMSVSGNDEAAVEVLRLILDNTKKDIANAVSGGDEKLGEAVLGFMKSLPLTIADPTDPKNLALPARELRAHELMALEAKPAEVIGKPESAT